MLSVEKTRMIRFTNNAENKKALVMPFNGKYLIRIFKDNEDTKEFTYSELSNAIKSLLIEGYFIEELFRFTYKYPEENRF